MPARKTGLYEEATMLAVMMLVIGIAVGALWREAVRRRRDRAEASMIGAEAARWREERLAAQAASLARDRHGAWERRHGLRSVPGGHV